MNFLDKMERKMGRCYIPNLMQYICLGMLGVFVLDFLPFGRSASSLLYFNRDLIMQGQIWRILTFIILPPNTSILFIVLALYFDYFLGTTLENRWGSRRFNLFYFMGVIGAVAAGFLTGYTTNVYLHASLFLAFAVLYGEMEVNLFFFLPIKVKYIALVDAAFLIYELISAPWMMKVALLLSMLPFIVFFGKDAYLNVRQSIRRAKFRHDNRR